MLSDEYLTEIAKRHGTPSYVFDLDEVCERALMIKGLMNENSPSKIGLCYSIKANPFLIPALVKNNAVDNLEVCSPGELSICERLRVPGSMIIYSGVHKEDEDISRALEYGAGVITAESLRHFELIKKAAERLDKNCDVILRLSSDNQFGMSLADIRHILKENPKKDAGVRIAGLHYFAGTQRTKLKHKTDELEKLKRILAELRNESGMELKKLEYGPGLPYPYFEKDDFSDTLRPLKELCGFLQDAAETCSLTVEMGRFIASSCGYYLTKACDVKRSDDNMNWCILDGGINHLNYLGQMMGMMVPVISQIRADGRLTEHPSEPSDWALCGSLCTTNDVLVRSYKTGSIEPGDLFIFKNAGAYSVTEAMALFLSRDLPRILTVEKGSSTLVRNSCSSWEINCGTL